MRNKEVYLKAKRENSKVMLCALTVKILAALYVYNTATGMKGFNESYFAIAMGFVLTSAMLLSLASFKSIIASNQGLLVVIILEGFLLFFFRSSDIVSIYCLGDYLCNIAMVCMKLEVIQ